MGKRMKEMLIGEVSTRLKGVRDIHVKGESLKGGEWGANMGLDGDKSVNTPQVLGTHTWKLLKVDFTQGPKEEARIAVRLSGGRKQAEGTAWFTDIRLVELKK